MGLAHVHSVRTVISTANGGTIRAFSCIGTIWLDSGWQNGVLFGACA